MAYRDSMLATARDLSVRGTITFSDASTFSLTTAHIKAFSVDEGSDNGLLLGTAASAYLRLTLANAAGEWLPGGSLLGAKSLTGSWIALEVGVYITSAYSYNPVGTFRISKTESVEGGTSIDLIGNDAMLSALSGRFTDLQTYPRTVDQILTYLAGAAGVSISGSLLCNGSVSIAVKPDWGDSCTYRQALGYIASVGGCFARVTRAGAFEVVPCYNGTVDIALTTDHYTALKRHEDAFALNRIVIIPRGATGTTATTEAAIVSGTAAAPSNTIEIEDNPLCREGAAALATIASGLLTALTGMTLMALDATYRGDPTLLIGDRLTLTDTRSVVTTTTLAHQTLDFSSGFKADIACGIETGMISIPSVLTPNGTIKAASFAEATIVADRLTPAAKLEIEDAANANLLLGGVNILKSTYLFDELNWTYNFPSGSAYGFGQDGTSPNTMLIDAQTLGSDFAYVLQPCAAVPSKEYVLSVNFLQTNADTVAEDAFVRAVEYDSGGTELAAHYIPVTSAAPNANKYVAFTTDADCATITVAAIAFPGFYLYWEKAKLEVGNKNTAWSEAIGECTSSGIAINESGVHIKANGNIIGDATGTIALFTGGQSATINNEPIWYGGKTGRVWVTTVDPSASMADGDIWLKPDTSTSKVGVWTKAALASRYFSTSIDYEFTGVAIGAGTGTYRYTVRIPIFHSSTNANSYTVTVYLAASSGGTTIPCGDQEFTVSGWYEKTLTDANWLGNAASIWAHIHLEADGSHLYLAVNSGAAMSVTCEDIVSGASSGVFPCEVYRKTII